MAQSTTNLGKIHVFPSETLYNQFKDIIADNDLALLKDDGAYIVAALLEQNGYVKFSNGLILQWGLASTSRAWATENKYPISFRIATFAISLIPRNPAENSMYTEQVGIKLCTKTGFYGGLQITCDTDNLFYIAIGI